MEFVNNTRDLSKDGVRKYAGLIKERVKESAIVSASVEEIYEIMQSLVDALPTSTS